MSSEEKEMGRSIVRMLRTWRRSAEWLMRQLLHFRPLADPPSSTAQKEKQLTILHDVPHDSKLVKVASTSLGSERLLERDLNVGDEVLVERGVEHDVGESEDEKVLDHLFAEVVVDAEDLRVVVG